MGSLLEPSLLCKSSVSHNSCINKGAPMDLQSGLHDNHEDVIKANSSCRIKSKLPKIVLLKFNGGEIPIFLGWFREHGQQQSKPIYYQ